MEEDEEARRRVREERRRRESAYQSQIGDLEETGATLREAWADILQTSHRQLMEMRQKLHVVKNERDDALRRLRDTRSSYSSFEDELVAQLAATKLRAAEFAMDIDDMSLRVKAAERRQAALALDEERKVDDDLSY